MGELEIKAGDRFFVPWPYYLNLHRKASEQETLKAISDIKRRIAKRGEEPEEYYDDSDIPF